MKEKVLKMSSPIDQSDESELLPPATSDINNWLQNCHAVMGVMPEESSTGSFGEEGVQGRCSTVCRFCGAWTVRKEVDKDSEVSHLHPVKGWNILAKRCTWTRNLPGMAGSLANFEDGAPHVECWRFMGNTLNGWRHSGRLLGG